MRRLAVVPALLVLVCGCVGEVSESETSITRPDSAAPVTEQRMSTSTTIIVQVSTTTTAVTTSAVSDVDVEKVFYVVPGPVNGQHTNLGIPITYGGVRPDAVVTLNGVEIQTEYCGAWVEWEDVYCWGFGVPQRGLPRINVELSAGLNTLTFEADYPDGEIRKQEFTIYYTPDLIEVEGWLVDIEPGDPTLALIDIVELEPGDDDGIDVIGDPERKAIPIASDAAFIILDRTTISARPERVLSFSEVHELVAREKNGETLQELYWGRILPIEDSGIFGVPSTFLLTPDGEIQQMEQWWSP